MTGFKVGGLLSMIQYVDVSAIQAAAAATTTTYRSFADATRSVLDLLERHMPNSAVFLAHLDRGQFIHRIVDVRRGSEYGLRSNQSLPLGDDSAARKALCTVSGVGSTGVPTERSTKPPGCCPALSRNGAIRSPSRFR